MSQSDSHGTVGVVHYGHRLEFGTFLTPSADAPHQVVALARLSEELGFDLATFQDHPYQPRFLDTWTLMTWVAAATERIRVAANVHNMALRSPAILAKSAASLDLLSDGRVDLGIGAGGFNDAVVAFGGPERTPGEGVEALEEAIAVIRALLDVEARGGARVDGRFHRLAGAKPGPVPTRAIPLWIGAVKPRMQRLVARLGDGWLPSLAYIGVDGLVEGNARIDAAAEDAGRDPREIRRLLNVGGRFQTQRTGLLQGTPADWIEDLLPLAVEHGVGTFILASDDPTTIRTFAEDVVPAIRAGVDTAVTGGSAGVALRTREQLALRRPSIDYDALPADLAAHAVEPGDRGYRLARGGYLRGGSPGLVLRPGTVGEVVAALRFARRHPALPLGVRSGGHGISGRSTNDGGLVIDLGRLNAITVLDEERRLVRVEAGATWDDVAAALEPLGWAISSGDYGGVGVGGLATAGGIGYLARSHGLTIDRMRAAELVLADGTIARVDEEHEPELFWAVRGAGGNVGIATAFEFEASDVPEVAVAQLTQVTEAPADYLVAWGGLVEAAPRDFSSFLILGPAGGGRWAARSRSVMATSDADAALARFRELADLAPLAEQEAFLAPYRGALASAAGEKHVSTGEPLAHSALIGTITPDFAAAVVAELERGAIGWFQLRPVGGAVADVPEDATAYAYRSAAFSVTVMGADRSALAASWNRLRPWFAGLYLSFETDDDPATIAAAFPPATLARLVDVKRRVDPDDVFDGNFDVFRTVSRDDDAA